jgi:hypothetical protein
VVISQHVRLFDEALAARQANCIDGTAVLAAVLRKIGIEPYLVLIPGRMFLAFDLDKEGETTLGLETTMMGDTAPSDSTQSRRIPGALADRFKNQASFKSFSAASLGSASSSSFRSIKGRSSSSTSSRFTFDP